MTGIVLLNYGKIDDTIACIRSIREHCRPLDYRLCVVDNASSRSVRETVGEVLGPDDKYILNDENLGYAAGNNCGLRYFDTLPEIDKVLILNNDVILTEDIITPLSAYLDSHGECGVVSPLLRDRNGNVDKACARKFKTARDLALKATSLGRLGVRSGEFILVAHPEYLSDAVIDIDIPSGSCMMLPKALFSRLGFFDPKTFLYFEEDILGTKLKRIGYGAALLTGIQAIHLGAGTTSGMASSFIYGCYRDSLLHYMDNYTDCPKPLKTYIRCRTALGFLTKK